MINLTVTQISLSQKETVWLFRPGDPNEVRHRRRQGIEIVRLMEEEREWRIGRRRVRESEKGKGEGE